MQQLLQPDDIDYVVIDLREGHRWLASRLYLFSELLHRQRGLQCIVFVDQRDSISRHLVGIADPVDVKWAMASRFPWLETALNDSYSQAFLSQPSPIAVSKSGGRLEPPIAEQVASNFLSHPAVHWADGQAVSYPWAIVYNAAGAIPPPWVPNPGSAIPMSPQNEWTIVHDQPNHYEHTRWLNGPYLAHVMGIKLLREDDWIAIDSRAGEETQVLDVLSRSGDFVAMVNIDRSFRRLIERRRVLEEVARREVRRHPQPRI